MEPEKKHIQGTSRRDEEKHLKETLCVIHANMESYGRQVREMRADIDEMLENYHDDNAEIYVVLCNTITMHDHMKRALERNERAVNKPYFGRICFYDQALAREESIYIGKGGISRDTTHQEIIDWRAPVANAYYENGLGPCSYPAPDGKPIRIDLKLKRTYEIEGGKLLDYYDSEVISNDELLTRYLARNKQAVLGEIVATIQKEQNDIIRKSPYHNIIVQGVAGSGKTTVAMHRISYILYNYAERFRPEDFYIVGSNRILLNYITGVLPGLDVYGVRQMTMEQLFVRLLYEDWDEKKYGLRKNASQTDEDKVKGTEKWFQALRNFCDRLERRIISTESVYLNPRQFVEGFYDGHLGVHDRSQEKTAGAPLPVLLLDGQAVERYIQQNPAVSIQSKINMLNERLLSKVKDEFSGKEVRYTQAERKAILKFYRGRYGSKNWKLSTFQLYDDFLREQAEAGTTVPYPKGTFDVYDLAALAYLYKRTKETEVISEAHHIVIDEAQDFGMMVYHCLSDCIKDCTYTIMGDVSQNIRFGFGLNDWEDLKNLFLKDPMSGFGVLNKSYRNTVEISHFATRILRHGKTAAYPADPIIRHGEPVNVTAVTPDRLYEEALFQCRQWQKKGLPTIAVICRDQKSADKTARELGKHVTILETDPEKAEFGNGIMVLPVEYTKGLEFDAVLILNPTRKEYPADDGHARLLYVAATRALHELCVLHCNDLTGLIADPVLESDKAANKSAETVGKHESDSIQRFAAARQPDTMRQSDTLRQPDTMPDQNPKKRTLLAVSPPASASVKAPSARRTATTGPKTSGKPKMPFAKPSDFPEFGDFAPTERLRPSGHPKIDLSVRWVMRQQDGLYLQSRYGLLRLSPIGSGILRVTFSKSGKLSEAPHPLIRPRKPDRFWTYKEAGPAVTFSTDELLLQVDKTTGAIRYFAQDKKLLLSERSRECRQQETFRGGNMQSWLFLEHIKKEQIFAVDISAFDGPAAKVLPLRGTAKYISPPQGLPLLYSDQGYGILIASDAPVLYCDLPAYGTYLHTENEAQMDYYFILGRKPETLMGACGYLLEE